MESFSGPCYVECLDGAGLLVRAKQAADALRRCELCARYCRVDRTRSIRGAVCRTGARAMVASYGAHHGEEPPLSGWAGSGTIFFSGCNLRCVYCQNWDISQKGAGHEVDAPTLAAIMLELQRRGCHNINFVSPSHVVAQILAAVALAAERGLRLPLVYNTGGYDSPEALALLDGVIDIYMPDMKYGDPETARRYSHVRDYVAVNRAAVREMHRQVGDLRMDSTGIARRGMLVRHLLLPNDLSGSEKIFDFLARVISPDTYLNLMDQYHPRFRAMEYPLLDRRVSVAELDQARTAARRAGLQRVRE